MYILETEIDYGASIIGLLFLLTILLILLPKIISYRRIKLSKVLRTRIIGYDEDIKTSDAIKRGLIGDLLLGEKGMIIGTLTTNTRYYTTFEVEYINGTIKNFTVDNSTPEYRALMKKLDKEKITK